MQLLKRIFAVDAAVVVKGGDVVAGFVNNAVGDFRNLTSAVGAGSDCSCGGCTGDEAK